MYQLLLFGPLLLPYQIVPGSWEPACPIHKFQNSKRPSNLGHHRFVWPNNVVAEDFQCASWEPAPAFNLHSHFMIHDSKRSKTVKATMRKNTGYAKHTSWNKLVKKLDPRSKTNNILSNTGKATTGKAMLSFSFSPRYVKQIISDPITISICLYMYARMYA